MRIFALALVAGVVALAAPAEAAWNGYITRTHGFSFDAPGEVKTQIGTYRGAIAGPHETVEYVSEEDGIKYRVMVINFRQAGAESVTILGEALFDFQQGRKVLMDAPSRVEPPGPDSVYGRKTTVELPEGGRAMAAFYFNKGFFIALEATVFPESGDLGSPMPGRFIDSIAFDSGRASASAIELKLPEY